MENNDIVSIEEEDQIRPGLIELINRMYPSHKCMPSKLVHCYRKYHNCVPKGTLTFDGVRDQKNRRVFIDSENQKWHEIPWYFNLFHKPWKNIKMVHFEKDYVENAPGSSEIIVQKKDLTSLLKRKQGTHVVICAVLTEKGSYNYRDFTVTNHWKHFWADIFPVIAYLKKGS